MLRSAILPEENRVDDALSRHLDARRRRRQITHHGFGKMGTLPAAIDGFEQRAVRLVAELGDLLILIRCRKTGDKRAIGKETRRRIETSLRSVDYLTAASVTSQPPLVEAFRSYWTGATSPVAK